MSEQAPTKQKVIVLDETTEWVICPDCDGDEGHHGDDDEWHNCEHCEGSGGWHRDRKPEGPTP